MRRPRVFAAGIARWSAVWTGPKGGDVEHAFKDWFGKCTEVSGDIFLQASTLAQRQHLMQIAEHRASHLPCGWEEKTIDELFHHLGPPSLSVRHQEWQIHYKKTGDPPQPFLCDLDHRPGQGPAGGKMWPTMLTHHTIASLSKKRLATDSECWLALGLDSIPGVKSTSKPSALAETLASYPSRHQQFLRGNSMHIPSITYWIIFVLAHCTPRSSLERLSPQPGPPGAATDDDEHARWRACRARISPFRSVTDPSF